MTQHPDSILAKISEFITSNELAEIAGPTNVPACPVVVATRTADHIWAMVSDWIHDQQISSILDRLAAADPNAAHQADIATLRRLLP